MTLVLGLDVAVARGCDAVVLGASQTARPIGRVHTGVEFRTLLDDLSPAAVAIDAPPGWATNGPRACERELTTRSISLFVTPTEARGAGHRFYAWMEIGFEMFAAAKGYETLETFPHAVAVAIHGRLPQDGKRASRLAALHAVGVETAHLRTVDQIDAALCAYTAWSWAHGRAMSVGDEREGRITLPVKSLLERYVR